MELTRREVLALAAIAVGSTMLPGLPAVEARPERETRAPARDDDEVWLSGVAGECSGAVEVTSANELVTNASFYAVRAAKADEVFP
jgi:hypothetical protein